MNHLNKTARWKAVAGAAALCAVPVLAACGSDDDSATGGADGSGDPIKVMVYGPFDAQGFSLPGTRTGAEAGVAKVNDAGGIGGRRLELIACDDGNDPNTAAACARQAVSEKVVAVIGGLSTHEPQLVGPLADAGIPMVGTTPVSTFDSPNQYPIGAGAPGAFFALGKYMATAPECGGTVSSVIEDFDATRGAIGLFQLAIAASGGTDAGVSGAAQGATDFAPAVAAAVGDAPCVGYLAGPQTTPTLLRALTSNGGAKLFGSTETSVPAQVLEALGPASDGSLVFSSFLPLSDATDTPEMKEFLDRSRDIDPDFAPEQSAAGGYLGALVLAEALKDVDVTDLSAADVVAALDAFGPWESGLGPTVDFTDKNPTKAFSRMPYSAVLYPWVASDGDYVLGEGDPISVDDIYDVAQAAGQ